MTRFDEQIQKIQQLRKQREDSEERLYATQLQINKLDKLLRQAKRTAAASESGGQTGGGLENERNRLQTAYEDLKKQLDLQTANLQQETAAIYVDPHPRASIGGLNDGIPFLLLPVRIETRFASVGRSAELWVRIYPDDVAIHTHEKLLTDDEVAAGTRYWKALFDAEKNGGEHKEDQKKAAWNELASSFGPQRAAWIAGQTKPVNWTPDLGGLSSPDDLQFPPQDQTKTDAWTRAPRTNVLPDRFVVMLYQGETLVLEQVGAPVPDELIVGPDPLDAGGSFRTEDGKLLFGGGFDWASDFDKAVALGMGFKIPLTAAQASAGFDKLLVLGVYLSADATASQARLEALLDNHHYSPKGFSLVPQGTPTNNTEQDGSGYSKNDPFNGISYFVEIGDPLFGADTDCDGRNLADALGIEYDPLQHILHADGVDYRQVVLMNKALYPATLGYFLETLLQPVIGQAGLDALRSFFCDNVTGRGPLPALRVGDQPYGVLLASNFGKWK